MIPKRQKFNGEIYTFVASAPDKKYAQAIVRGYTPFDARGLDRYYIKLVKNPAPIRDDIWLVYKRTRKRRKK